MTHARSFNTTKRSSQKKKILTVASRENIVLLSNTKIQNYPIPKKKDYSKKRSSDPKKTFFTKKINMPLKKKNLDCSFEGRYSAVTFS